MLFNSTRYKVFFIRYKKPSEVMEAKKHTRINENEWSFQRSNTSSNQNHNCFKKIINLALVATASGHQLELFENL